MASTPTPSAPIHPISLDPADAVTALSGLSIAGDGIGGLVYLAQVDGVDHVFVMRIDDGKFAAPVELDGSLAGASSQPVIAASGDGRLVVAFVNGGDLYTSHAVDTDQPLSKPTLLVSDASNPTVSLNQLGQGYLAFTKVSGAGDDIEVYWFGGVHWHLAEPEPFNASPDDDAGTGSGRPSVVAAHDGVGIVAWGENGHVYSRRVWDSMTSVETEDLDPASVEQSGSDGAAPTEWQEVDAADPAVATDGDSTYMDIAFQEELADGSQTISGVFVARLVAEDVESVVNVDGLGTLDSGGGLDPQIVMDELGYGLVADTTVAGGSIVATPLTAQGKVGTPTLLDSGEPVAEDLALAATGGSGAMTAWLQQSGSQGGPQVMASYVSDAADLGAMTPLSSAAGGTVDQAAGLLAGGDTSGDGVAVWLQGPSSNPTIHVGALLVAPGAPQLKPATQVTNRIRPSFRWDAAREEFGKVRYKVLLDGIEVGQTTGRSWKLGYTLAPGVYHWSVQATNVAQQTTASSQDKLTVTRYHKPKPKKKRHTRGKS